MTKLLWVPADIPKLETKNLLVDSYKRDYKNKENARAFESQQFTIKSDNYQVSNYKEEYLETHRYLINYIAQHLPFDHLVNIKIHRPVAQGRTHIDFLYPDKNKELYENNNSLEPCGYRMVIAGRRNGHLYVKTAGQTIYPILPEDTDWYIISSTTALHGLNDKDDSRFILFCHGYINKEKHQDILTRSIDKYKDYAIWG
jgi:hypothetical protein